MEPKKSPDLMFSSFKSHDKKILLWIYFPRLLPKKTLQIIFLFRKPQRCGTYPKGEYKRTVEKIVSGVLRLTVYG